MNLCSHSSRREMSKALYFEGNLRLCNRLPYWDSVDGSRNFRQRSNTSFNSTFCHLDRRRWCTMPDIPVGAQIFDLVFHPTESLACVGLLSGEIKAFSYDEQGNYENKFTVKPSKRSCRGLALNQDGSRLWSVGKGKMLRCVDLSSVQCRDG